MFLNSQSRSQALGRILKEIRVTSVITRYPLCVQTPTRTPSGAPCPSPHFPVGFTSQQRPYHQPPPYAEEQLTPETLEGSEGWLCCNCSSCILPILLNIFVASEDEFIVNSKSNLSQSLQHLRIHDRKYVTVILPNGSKLKLNLHFIGYLARTGNFLFQRPSFYS